MSNVVTKRIAMLAHEPETDSSTIGLLMLGN